MNPFPALTAPFSLIILSSFFIASDAAFEALLSTNPGKLSEGTAQFNIVFFV